MKEARITVERWSDELRSHIDHSASLNEVYGTQEKKNILFVNGKPFVVKVGHEDFWKEE